MIKINFFLVDFCSQCSVNAVRKYWKLGGVCMLLVDMLFEDFTFEPSGLSKM